MSNNEKPEWAPIKGQIMSRWAKDITPENPFPEYPRPQFKRAKWMNLNGLWDYAIRPKKLRSVTSFDGKIPSAIRKERALT